jgi:hypothetical protein
MAKVAFAFALGLLLAGVKTAGANASVPPPVAVTIDADPATAGIQAARTVNEGPTWGFTVDVLIASVSDLSAFNFELVYDQTKLSAPTISTGPDTDRNPDAEQAFLASTGRTWSCSPPAPTGDADPSATVGAARLVCFSTGGSAGPSVGASPVVLAHVQFTAISSVSPTSSLTLRNLNTFAATGVETGSCNPIVVKSATCTGATITVNNDNDGDTIVNNLDNCPSWPNPTQALPVWVVPANDPDCDGVATAAETFMGTDPNTHCAQTATANDEPPPDAWPFDFNNDQKASLPDVLGFISVFNTVSPDPRYDARFDVSGNGHVDLPDVLSFIPVFNQRCA